MIDTMCLSLMESECERDYKKKHYWERRGLFRDANDIHMVWQCTQCSFCVLEELEFMNQPKFKEKNQSNLWLNK